MTQDQIEKSAKIARFMGRTVVLTGDSKDNCVLHDSSAWDGISFTTYHESWEAIMEVMQKIERTGAIVSISLCLAGSVKIWNNKSGWHVLTEDNDPITACFDAAAEYAEWYSKNKEA